MAERVHAASISVNKHARLERTACNFVRRLEWYIAFRSRYRRLCVVVARLYSAFPIVVLNLYLQGEANGEADDRKQITPRTYRVPRDYTYL